MTTPFYVLTYYNSLITSLAANPPPVFVCYTDTDLLIPSVNLPCISRMESFKI
ncbi:hypothetical protein PSHT_16601 [Puccinia striiformis]|uniref:Uncharacterized protein n=1 Tax=Puccinia striiformis TaxID=27350 RepID=A0A2S4U9B2_9BASI|nr:hypothetical protein PSHT_16601 [Puccinia striiformis]